MRQTCYRGWEHDWNADRGCMRAQWGPCYCPNRASKVPFLFFSFSCFSSLSRLPRKMREGFGLCKKIKIFRRWDAQFERQLFLKLPLPPSPIPPHQTPLFLFQFFFLFNFCCLFVINNVIISILFKFFYFLFLYLEGLITTSSSWPKKKSLSCFLFLYWNYNLLLTTKRNYFIIKNKSKCGLSQLV